MIEKGMTVKEAAQRWVGGFDAIQQGMIKKLMDVELEEWHEVTKPAVGNRVYVYEETASGEINKVNSTKSKYRVKMDSGKEIWVEHDDIEIEFDTRLPMWGNDVVCGRPLRRPLARRWRRH